METDLHLEPSAEIYILIHLSYNLTLLDVLESNKCEKLSQHVSRAQDKFGLYIIHDDVNKLEKTNGSSFAIPIPLGYRYVIPYYNCMQ